MDTGIEGKKALVLASSDGLGFATGKELLAEGATVMFTSRDKARASAAAEPLAGTYGEDRVLTGEVDVSDAQSLSSLFEDAETALGGIDLLVCNAGGPPPGTFDTVGDDKWELAFNLTLMSVVRSVRAAVPRMQGRDAASILVIGSSSVKRPIPNLLLSNVYRPAIKALVTDISADLAGKGIRINMLCPGRIHTGRVDRLDEARAEREGRTVDEIRAAAVSNIPMKRLGQPQEFAKAAVFLLGTAGSYMTGSTLLVDGGAVRVL